MKMEKMLVTMLLATVLTMGCSNPEPPALTNPSTYGELPSKGTEQDLQVEMSIPKKNYAAGTEKVSIEVKNHGSDQLLYGVAYQVEKREQGTWYAIPFQPNTAFVDIGIIVEPNHTRDEEMNLKMLDYPMTNGEYRMIKSFYVNGRELTLATYFTIGGETSAHP
ncbi:immunoglobulin-like domain-containing protein [Brevibacillus reuszeri]|uniref:immunoglobulin-like domain-containing protein n=1 Tax=Brevibacillus reuszeri TaxID=54915 RepID=UPI002899BD40|nr:immunoglobulin-like domain-containing protein [Brevibacillus reuszeri]